ncbi:MAG: IS66 family transposase [Bacteroidales bacterium]|nr:IS66 family transposase [Bacteroidales bacterium]
MLILKDLISNYKILDKKYEVQKLKIRTLEEKILELESKETKAKISEVNKSYSKPTSKQPEWEDKGVGNDGKGKKKGRGKKGRKNSGNKSKNRLTTCNETVGVEKCAFCGKDLSEQTPIESTNTRIIEDIPEIPIELKVIEVVQEKKYCSECQKITTAKSDLALSKSDFGLNTTIATVYLWIASGLSFPRISSILNTFFGQQISTSGLSKHVIRISKIMTDVYSEIREDIKQSDILQADETGWRVNGKNWWLWVFGTKDSAFYTIDKSRGKDVVRRILGEIFIGVLVVDGWGAYLSLNCEQQSCMAHLLRKIRKLHAAFPKLRSVRAFYVKFRKILRDGERLQKQREQLGKEVFGRRLKKLHHRLDELLKWENPNEILEDIIKKVVRQRSRILTFVEHEHVPCHNNYAEYLIRIGVLKRKVSFGSKSQEGAEAYAVLLSIYTTCRLRKILFVDFMKASLKQHIKTGKTMLIKKYVEHDKNCNVT